MNYWCRWGIQEQDTVDYRDKITIPSSDSSEPEERTDVHKRSRSDTVSATHSQDSYTHHQPSKKTRLELDNVSED